MPWNVTTTCNNWECLFYRKMPVYYYNSFYKLAILINKIYHTTICHKEKKKNFIGNFTCRFYYNNSTQKLRLSMMVCIYFSISKPQMDRNFIFNKLILALFLNMNWIQFNSPFYIQLFLFKINLFSLYLANIFMVQSISLSNQILN